MTTKPQSTTEKMSRLKLINGAINSSRNAPDEPWQCCDGFGAAEDQGAVIATEAGYVLCLYSGDNESDIVGDIDFCPFCATRLPRPKERCTSNDNEKVETRISPASAAPVVDEQRGEPMPEAEIQAAIAASKERLHWPFTVKHDNCAECDKEYEAPPAAATAAPQHRFCGFCHKSDHEVKVLIAASVGYICDECVAICASIIERNQTAASVKQSDKEGKD